jgi:protein-tyrosine phosphatase
LKESLLKKPFERSFAVFPNWLWGGAYPGDSDPSILQNKMRGLADCGVQAVFNLMEKDETDYDGKLFVPYHKEFMAVTGTGNSHYSNLPIPDDGIVNAPIMSQYLDQIHAAVAQTPTFVHCWGGRGRTGTVLGCFLVDAGLATGPESLLYLRRIRILYKDVKATWPAPQTRQQQMMVLNWNVTPKYAQRYQAKKWEKVVTFVRKVIDWRTNGEK